MPPSLSGPSQSPRGQNGISNPGFGATPGGQNSVGISQGTASSVVLVAAPAPGVRRPGSAQSDISLDTNASGDALLPPNSPLFKGSEGSRRRFFSTSLDISMIEETASVGRESSTTRLAESIQEAPVSRTENRPRSHSSTSNNSMVQERDSVGRESVDSKLAESFQEASVLRTGNRPRAHSFTSNNSMVQERDSVGRESVSSKLAESFQEAPVLRTGNRRRTLSSSSDISMGQEPGSDHERRSSDASLEENPLKPAEQEKKADKDSTSKESSSHPYLDRLKKNLKDGAERVLAAFDKRLVKPFNDTFDKHVKEPLEPILKPLAKVLKPVATLFKTIAKALAVAMVLAAKLLNEIRKIGQEIAVNAWNLLAPHLFATRDVMLKVSSPISKLFQKKKKEPDDSSKDGEQANNDKSNNENVTQENNPSGRNETAENYLLAQQAAQHGQQHS